MGTLFDKDQQEMGSRGGIRKWSRVEEPVMYHLRNYSVHLPKSTAGRTRDAGSLERG